MAVVLPVMPNLFMLFLLSMSLSMHTGMYMWAAAADVNTPAEVYSRVYANSEGDVIVEPAAGNAAKDGALQAPKFRVSMTTGNGSANASFQVDAKTLNAQIVVPPNKTVILVSGNEEIDLAPPSTRDTSATLGDVKAHPAKSCQEIKTKRPTAKSGVFWIHRGVPGSQLYLAYCILDRYGGGWEVVWKNVGSFNNGRLIPFPTFSNYALRNGANNMSPVWPPLSGDIHSHGSAISETWEETFKLRNVEWLRIAEGFNGFTLPVFNNEHLFGMTGDANMYDAFYIHPGSSESCKQSNGNISVSINGKYIGWTTLYLRRRSGGAKGYGFALSGGDGHLQRTICAAEPEGFNLTLPNQYTHTVSDEDWHNYFSFSPRPPGVGTIDINVNHVLSFYDATGVSDGNAIRCNPCCWGSTTSQCTEALLPDHHLTHMFAVREQLQA